MAFDLIYDKNILFFFSSRRRHTKYIGDWSSDVCSSDLVGASVVDVVGASVVVVVGATVVDVVGVSVVDVVGDRKSVV